MVKAPEETLAMEAQHAEAAPEAPAARRARAPAWALPAMGMALALGWLALRPAAPHGVSAVVDLLVLPALLFAEVRLLAGSATVARRDLALLFGLGAVLATSSALVLERAALVAGRSTLEAVGPLVEVPAVVLPVAVAGLLSLRQRRWTVADLTLSGLASGLGFLVVRTSLATSALHVAPAYETPLLAGLERVPASAGSPPAYFVGHALAGALVGLALGWGLRWRARPWRLVPAGLALSLVVFDHGVFVWRLRHLAAGEAARTTGLADLAQRIALQGRLALLLLVAGLAADRWFAGHPGRRGAADRRSDAPASPADEMGEEAEDLEGGDGAAGGPVEGPPADAGPAAAGGDDPEGPVRQPAPAWVSLLAMAVAVGVGIALTLLARSRQLGFLGDRRLALAVCLLGLGYSLWHLPAAVPGQPGPALRALLGIAALVSSGLGVMVCLLPRPEAAVALHGALLLETVLAWGATVGNVGLILGLGGFAAPAVGHRRRLFGDRWSALVLNMLGWSGWWGGERRRGLSGGREERVRWKGGRGRRGRRGREASEKGPGGSFLRVRLTDWALARRLRGRRGSGGGPVEWSPSSPDLPVAIAIEPVYRPPGAQMEFVGATVKEAIEAAMREVGTHLAHNALQLVDQGMPPKPGKPGTGRPARVRVSQAREENQNLLVPPARDSVTRSTPFAVVVEAAAGKDDPPPSVSVSLRSSTAGRAHTRALVCPRVDSPPDRPRYRSNPYSVDAGEDTTWGGAAGVVGAGGIRVDNGGAVTAQYRGERATTVIYDGWPQQVVAVNRWLFDLTEAHHRSALAQLEARLREVEGNDPEAERIRYRIGRLEARLRMVDEGRRLLSVPLTVDPSTRDEAKAFRSTAVLHRAMAVDDEDEVSVADAEAALAAAEGEPAGDPVTAYRDFLARTVPGQLWAGGAYSVEDVARLLGWDRFTEEGPTVEESGLTGLATSNGTQDSEETVEDGP